MEKHKLKISICDAHGLVLDMFDVFTTEPKRAVEEIVNSIENGQWTDEQDFDDYLREMNSNVHSTLKSTD